MSKRTGATRESTKWVVAGLERKSRKEKNKIWKDLAERISRASRQRAKVSVEKIEKIAERFKGKKIAVPGKVLGNSKIKEKVEVIALDYSQNARKAIEKAGGKAFSFKEVLEKPEKFKPSEILIIE